MGMVQKPPVWLDMDPGIDDAWAMALALAACDVRGISAVAGNVSLPHTFANAQKILRTLSVDDRPVLPGAIGPLLTPLMTAPAFHGVGGLADWGETTAAPVDPQDERVWSWWSTHRAEIQGIHLIATGPLTNLAISFLAFPALADIWGSITLMCGVMPGAQTDKAQEFNVYVDPHAADYVFHWGRRVRLVGIHVAHQALIPLEDLSRLGHYGKAGAMLSRVLPFYVQEARGEGGNPNAFPVDDVVAVASVVRPDLFQWRDMPLAVVREGPLRGTVVLSPIDVKRPPVQVATDIDVDGFRQWVWDTMEYYAEHPTT